ncbi:hypothetical protein UFOVP1124_23 [uncultured Caudovirales phage]|uniref:Uncharacterized protein n=1 Tax=uncultured Caudovirales phage TaxID=2100421 RepID=A0A6J5QJS4_9CAUD|nr:hypothetical protein UFOVP1124_23 [uncultured Caudovirales phage]
MKWKSLVAWLVSWSADPAEVDREAPRAAAAVAVAYAELALPSVPVPPAPPPPAACACGGKCANGVYRPDGKIPQKCAPGCATCKAPGK